MSISNYLENAYLDVLRNQSLAVSNVYIKLHTGDPGEAGTNNAATEATRKLIAFSAASSGSMASSAAITWTNVSTTETYSHWSAWDSLTTGNCLWTGALSSSAAVTAGDTFEITTLTLSLD
jgi:hypothetical protein